MKDLRDVVERVIEVLENEGFVVGAMPEFSKIDNSSHVSFEAREKGKDYWADQIKITVFISRQLNSVDDWYTSICMRVTGLWAPCSTAHYSSRIPESRIEKIKEVIEHYKKHHDRGIDMEIAGD